MAIKVNGTAVITDDRKLSVAGATSNIVARDFHPNSTTTNNVINFSQPFLTCTLGASTEFSLTGVTEGASTILLLDTSTVPYGPSWPSTGTEINWAEGTEPTWGNYRRWQITLHCWSSTRVDATAIPFTSISSTPTEAVTLQGAISSNPETFYDQAGSNANDLIMGWKFDADGNVYKYESIYNVGGQGTYLHDSTTWNNITPSQTYYIRVANHSGSSLSVSDSDTLNTWLALSSDREFRVRDSRNLTSYADMNCVMKVEISSTSNGSNILATGYYECEWSGLA
tara:strand:+ start:13913 stop:14761 length:849 start_codon:yes stop_codon:yes gene_type:complete